MVSHATPSPLRDFDTAVDATYAAQLGIIRQCRDTDAAHEGNTRYYEEYRILHAVPK